MEKLQYGDPLMNPQQDGNGSIITSARLRLMLLRTVPPNVKEVLARLVKAGWQAYLVGGCVRDLLLGRDPKDWDIATSAHPRQVMSIFLGSIPTGIKHGTVTVFVDGKPVEVTTYRVESGYSDLRHPDHVEFTQDLTEDLARRDFTVNAIALSPDAELVDPYRGTEDLRLRIIRAVGRPAHRFREDPLRMLRAVRFAAELGFSIEDDTYTAIKDHASLLEAVSLERIRDEFTSIILSETPGGAIETLRDTGLLKRFIPELLEGVGFEQNVHHEFTVWEHSIKAIDHTPDVLSLRLAALFHDIAKPRCLSVDEEGRRRFFHHELVGAEMTAQILRRLRYDNQTINRTAHLVRHHLALHHYPDMTDAAVRRLIRRVGLEAINDLILLRQADRIASGTKRGPVSRGTRRLLQRIEKVLAEDAAFGLKDLAVDGHDVMRVAGIKPGPMVGRVLNQLLEEVLDDPGLNEKERLERRITEIVAEKASSGNLES